MKTLILNFECDRGSAIFATGFGEKLIENERRIKAQENNGNDSGIQRIQDDPDCESRVVSMGMDCNWAQVSATLDGVEIDPHYMNDPGTYGEEFEEDEEISRSDCLIYTGDDDPKNTVFFEFKGDWDHVCIETIETYSSEAELTLQVDDDFRFGDLTLVLMSLESPTVEGLGTEILKKIYWHHFEDELYAIEYKGKRYLIDAQYSGGGQENRILSRIDDEWEIDEELEELFEDEW